MSRLHEFLKELSDLELAHFYRFRYKEFIPASREKILEEMKGRGMDENELDIYTGTIPPDAAEKIRRYEMCPRCYSEKFYNSRETEMIQFSFASVEHEVDYKTCLVCLYSDDKAKSESKVPIRSAFGFLKAMLNRKI